MVVLAGMEFTSSRGVVCCKGEGMAWCKGEEVCKEEGVVCCKGEGRAPTDDREPRDPEEDLEVF